MGTCMGIVGLFKHLLRNCPSPIIFLVLELQAPMGTCTGHYGMYQEGVLSVTLKSALYSAAILSRPSRQLLLLSAVPYYASTKPLSSVMYSGTPYSGLPELQTLRLSRQTCTVPNTCLYKSHPGFYGHLDIP